MRAARTVRLRDGRMARITPKPRKGEIPVLIDLVFVIFRDGARHLLFFRRHPFDLTAWWTPERQRYAALFNVSGVVVDTVDLQAALDEEL